MHMSDREQAWRERERERELDEPASARGQSAFRQGRARWIIVRAESFSTPPSSLRNADTLMKSCFLCTAHSYNRFADPFLLSSAA